MPPRKKPSRFPPGTATWVDDPNLLDKPENFLDKLTVLYGPSESGKTVFMRHIIQTIGANIPWARVFTLTPLNFKEIPPVYITEGVCMESLRDLWELQQTRTTAYHRANNLEKLKKLAMRVPGFPVQIQPFIDRAEAMRKEKMAVLEESDAEAISKDCNTFIARACRLFIQSHEPELKAMVLPASTRKALKTKNPQELRNIDNGLHPSYLSAEEEYTFTWYRLNPRVLLVFDDVSSDLARFKKPEDRSLLENLFFVGRNRFITTIIAMHDDKLLDTALRKNAHISIFTAPTILRTFFARASMNCDPEVKERGVGAADNAEAFENFHKIAFFKTRPSDKAIVRIRATKFPKISFGSASWRAYGKHIEALRSQISDGGVYSKDFGL